MLCLGPPVERLEKGYPLFSVVYFTRRTLPKESVKEHPVVVESELLHATAASSFGLF